MNRFDDFLTLCEVCFVQVPSAEVAALLFGVVAVLFIWGITAIVSSFRMIRPHRRWDIRYWWPPRFSFWLGVFMLFDMMVYIFFALSTARDDSNDGTALWALVLVLGLFLSAITAFIFWARERKEGS